MPHRMLTLVHLSLLLVFLLWLVPRPARAQSAADRVCPRPAEGSIVPDPPVLASHDGLLDVHLNFRGATDEHGQARFCFVTETGVESPTLLVAPGDRLQIHLRNELPPAAAGATPVMAGMSMPELPAVPSVKENDAKADPCRGLMTAASTNLHFHGMPLAPRCHQDESIHTLVAPGGSFDYSITIPATNPPGLYWYHPHAHGISSAQVQGGASGGLIVDGIRSAVPALAALPERIFLLRDQLLPPGQADKTDPRKPGWDISLNYVPIHYPAYKTAIVETVPASRQLWRFVNSAANTIFHLSLLGAGGKPVTVQVYAVDGVPLSSGPMPETSLFLPPGSRVEFVVTTPAVGESLQLVTAAHDPGPAGDSAPARPIARVVASAARHDVAPPVPAHTPAVNVPGSLRNVRPIETRSLYFSQNGNGTEGGAGAATKFFMVVIGQPIREYSMSGPPNIVAHAGTVEDWNLTNMTPEDHIFHIHQVHFQLLEVDGVPVDDDVIRDTILVPHQVGRTPISNIKIRIDFRDPAIVGTFVYHCHILDHEDRGMMGSIQILPPEPAAGSAAVPAAAPAATASMQ